jgi:membrane protein YqaA with SNARE-associated domain
LHKRKVVDAFNISWVKSSIILGVIFLTLGIALILILKSLNIRESRFLLIAKNMINNYGFLGIFIATILAGTILPLGSPSLIVIAASFGLHPIPLALIGSIGFTIGMTINYALAYSFGKAFVIKKISKEKLEETLNIWMNWGWPIYLIFGFIPALPIELLSFLCGLLKIRLRTFLILTFIPRFIVFIVLAYFGEQIGQWLKII